MMRFEQGGWWMPEGERHLQQWMLRMRQPCYGRLGYQKHKYDAAVKLCRQRRLAVDIGAHVALWSWPLSHDFAGVTAFEPMSEHRACYARNMEVRGNWKLYACALGAEQGTVRVATRTPGSSGDTGVDPDAERSSLRATVGLAGEEAPLWRLDDFELAEVDLIKADCEGYELFVMQGAEETLLRCRPVVIVEQKKETGMKERYGISSTDAVKFLEELGMRRRASIQGDFILSWN